VLLLIDPQNYPFGTTIHVYAAIANAVLCSSFLALLSGRVRILSFWTPLSWTVAALSWTVIVASLHCAMFATVCATETLMSISVFYYVRLLTKLGDVFKTRRRPWLCRSA